MKALRQHMTSASLICVCRKIKCSPSHESPDHVQGNLHRILGFNHNTSLQNCPGSARPHHHARDLSLCPVAVGPRPGLTPTTSNYSSPAISLCPSLSSALPIPSPDTHSHANSASSIGQKSQRDHPGSADHLIKSGTRGRSPAVDVVGLNPMKKAPRANSVKQYHQLGSMHGVVFYQALEVTDEYGTQHCFDVRAKTQGALVSIPLHDT